MRSYAQVLSTDLGRLERIQADRSCEAARLPKLESSRFLVMCTARRTDSFRGRPGSMSRSAWCNKVVYPSWSACHMMFGVSRVSSYFGSSSSNIAVAQIAKTPKLPCGEWSLPRAGSTRLDGTRTELTNTAAVVIAINKVCPRALCRGLGFGVTAVSCSVFGCGNVVMILCSPLVRPQRDRSYGR